MQVAQNTRNDIADLIARGFSEAQESAAISSLDSSALQKVTSTCVALFSGTHIYSSDIYLHKLIRFLCYCEQCSDIDVVNQQKQAFLDSLQTHVPFLNTIKNVLLKSESCSVVDTLSLLLLEVSVSSENSTRPIALKDVISTDTELLLRGKADQQNQPNIKLLKIFESPLTVQQLREQISIVVNRLTSQLNIEPVSVVACIFQESYLEIWTIIAERVHSENTSPENALWRTVVSYITQDTNAATALFSLCMFLVYVEGIVETIQSLVPGKVRVQPSVPLVPSHLPPPSPYEDASASVSVPVFTPTVPEAITAPPEKDNENSRIVVLKIDDSSRSEPPPTPTDASVVNSTSVSTIASLQRFVDLNQNAFPDGLPKGLQL